MSPGPGRTTYGHCLRNKHKIQVDSMQLLWPWASNEMFSGGSIQKESLTFVSPLRSAQSLNNRVVFLFLRERSLSCLGAWTHYSFSLNTSISPLHVSDLETFSHLSSLLKKSAPVRSSLIPPDLESPNCAPTSLFQAPFWSPPLLTLPSISRLSVWKPGTCHSIPYSRTQHEPVMRQGPFKIKWWRMSE